MVQEADQTAGRFAAEVRMYKAPPPEISSEQFYETDPRSGVRPRLLDPDRLPSPHRLGGARARRRTLGRALRECMRDYHHWFAIGALCELLPQADNRVTLADERDQYGMPIARFDHSRCDNDRRNMAYARGVITDLLRAARAQDVLSITRYAHLIGGCRMATSPAESVVDRH